MNDKKNKNPSDFKVMLSRWIGDLTNHHLEVWLHSHLEQALFSALPPDWRNGVKPRVIQVEKALSGTNKTVQWWIDLKNSALAHRFHFLIPELERQIQQALLPENCPVPNGQWTTIYDLTIKIKAQVKPELWANDKDFPREIALKALQPAQYLPTNELRTQLNDFLDSWEIPEK